MATLSAGARLGAYQVAEYIGAGGMGEVYRARDTRLGRTVAIKILAGDLAANPARRSRFQREARAISSLTHPHICTLYDVGEADGLAFLVMEHLAGETLADRLGRGPLPIDQALTVAMEIAEALAAAHRNGIIHRDLKPGNVMLTKAGAKLLDFGLAKLTGEEQDARPQASTWALPLTGEQVLVGTLRYMAPEQLEGKPAHPRSDLWAFGATVYEMVAGRPAFEGSSGVSLVSAILAREPVRLSTLQPLTPPGVEWLVRRCLEKAPDDRPDTAHDVATELRWLRDIGPFQSSTPAASADGSGNDTERVPPAAEDPRRWNRLYTLGLLAIVTAAVVLGFAPPWGERDAQPTVQHIDVLTDHDLRFPPFPSEMPMVTDGARLFFTEWVDNGLLRVRQMPIGGGESTVLPLPVERHQVVVGISPDGAELLVGSFAMGAMEGLPCWIVSTVGGARRRLADRQGQILTHGAQWLSDGRILFVTRDAVYLLPAGGADRQLIVEVPGVPSWPSLAPDGQRIRFTLNTRATMLRSLWEVRIDGSGLRQLLPTWTIPANQCCGVWTRDGRHYVFQATRDGRTHLWTLDERAPDAAPRPLTSGPLQFQRPLVGRDGTTIFAVGWTQRGELARYQHATGVLLRHQSGLSAEWVDVSLDGQWMTYVSYPERDLWIARADGTQRLRLSSPPMHALAPRWSADGGVIAFMGWSPGRPWQVYRVSRSGGPPHDLVPGERHELSPSWSSDGTRIALAAENAVHVVDVASGQSTLVPGSEGLRSPAWSPDGRWLVTIDGADRFRILDWRSSHWHPLGAKGEWIGSPVWSSDSRHVYFWALYHSSSDRGGVYRVRVGDGHVEGVFPFASTRLVWGIASFWLGLTRDDEPMLLRDESSHDIYALRLAPE